MATFEEMGIRHERVRFSIPTRELERRWKAVRAVMEQKGVDLIVARNDNQWLGGYIRWFTDVSAQHGYPITMFFPRNDEMTLISHGAPPLPPAPPSYSLRGVKDRIPVPYMCTLNYTYRLEVEAAAKLIRARGDKRIGFVNLGTMSYPFVAGLKEALSGVEWVDFTDEIDAIKAIKSEDEMVYIRRTIHLQDIVCDALPAIVRPGVYEYEIRQAIVQILEMHGGEEQLFSMSSGPVGTFAGHTWVQFQNRRLDKGDILFIMIEVNGPGGVYGELGRTWALGEPDKGLLDFWDIALEGQKLVAGLSKPGVMPATILDTYNEYLASKGFPKENRLLAHGQGYDLVERPAYVPSEKMPLQAGMNIAIHPTIMNDKWYAFCCDNYYIGENGAELMHKTPQEIIVID